MCTCTHPCRHMTHLQLVHACKYARPQPTSISRIISPQHSGPMACGSSVYTRCPSGWRSRRDSSGSRYGRSATCGTAVRQYDKFKAGPWTGCPRGFGDGFGGRCRVTCRYCEVHVQTWKGTLGSCVSNPTAGGPQEHHHPQRHHHLAICPRTPAAWGRAAPCHDAHGSTLGNTQLRHTQTCVGRHSQALLTDLPTNSSTWGRAAPYHDAHVAQHPAENTH